MLVSSSFKRLFPYLVRYRRRFTQGFVFVIFTTSIQLVSPWVLKYVVDDLTLGLTRGKLAIYAGLLVGIAIIGGVCRFQMRRIIIGASREIEYDLRADFFAHLQRLPVAYFQKHRTGDLMSRATNDLSAVRMMVGPAIMYSATTSIVFVAAVILMVSISPRLAFFALLPLPVVSVLVKVFGSAIYQRSERIQEQLAYMSATVQEALAGVRVVRAYRREQVELDRFRIANEEYVARSRRVIQLQGLFYPSMGLFLGLSALIVLWLGSRIVLAGDMTLGDFVAFNGYLVMLSWPMIAFGWVTNILQRGLAAWDRMLKVLNTEPSITDVGPNPAILSLNDVSGQVEFKDLSFTYSGEQVLNGISVRVEPGQTLALVGPTGSGKSTLVNLLPRVFDPPPGTVFIDGVDVRDMSLRTLRSAIGYVPQEPFLFSDTLAENVGLGASPRTAHVSGNRSRGDAIRHAVAISRLDKDVVDFSNGLETTIGERGITLSGGQKQRVALARALLVDPRILILDDAFSAVDTQTEEEILTGLRRVMRHRTSIIISHRISTVRFADVILVLEEGKVVERGSHAMLMAVGGSYARLYRKQQLEEELDRS